MTIANPSMSYAAPSAASPQAMKTTAAVNIQIFNPAVQAPPAPAALPTTGSYGFNALA